ncbi:MAG: arginine deiminase [Acidobacteria bacterium]|nr:arginine deiminase [Acidobacteriota bacterium]MYA45258.1 arginine deiminase [Acidobacteriota bacterium]MYI40161.1 arginine deiminase [Acidobacteriota bacterium]
MATATLAPAPAGLGPPNMCGKLVRALLIGPRAVGWNAGASWRELGYLHPPEEALAARQHERIRSLLLERGVDIVEPDAAVSGLTPDAVYCHDASFPSRRGMILMRMGKQNREGEPAAHARIYEAAGFPVIGAVEAPGLAEGGDLVWLDEHTLLAGEGYRTNAAGIAQLGEVLAEDGVEVVTAPLPFGDGPHRCLHLMSLISVLDRRTMVADLRFLGVPTFEMLRARGWEFIPIVENERPTMAANVLALGGRTLLAIAANHETNARLRAAGFEVLTYEGSEISQNGSGGPTCLTRPLVRAAS